MLPDFYDVDWHVPGADYGAPTPLDLSPDLTMPESNFYDVDWRVPSLDYHDPAAGLMVIPRQSPIQDPAQEAFQFPFQYPSQDPSGGEGGQYAPVDVPENPLQEFVGLFGEDRPSLTEDVSTLAAGMAERMGFEQGADTANQGLLGNILGALRAMGENPSEANAAFDDLGGLFGQLGDMAHIPQVEEGNREPMTWGDMETGLTGQELGDSLLINALETHAVNGDELNASGSPVVTQTATMAAIGADTGAAGQGTEATGLDVAPVVGDLLDLAAGS